MGKVPRQAILALAFITMFLMVISSPALAIDVSEPSGDINIGPFIEKIVYKVITQDDQQVLALQDDEIDIIFDAIDPSFMKSLEAISQDCNYSVEIPKIFRNGYGHITINCRDYPLNISALRKAFAFAFNKTKVVADIYPGYGIQEHDSIVPYPNGWCIEDELPYHYYTAEVEKGAALLDKTGFTIDPESGFRLAPDGSAFNITIEYPAVSSGPPFEISVQRSWWTGNMCQVGVDALIALDIDAYLVATDPSDSLSRVYNNGNFDMVYYACEFQGYEVDWLAYYFWGVQVDVPYENPCNFRNETYDVWRYQLLHCTDYVKVYEAATEMQKILHENVPMLVIYKNFYQQAYRTDRFTGFVENPSLGVANSWTLRKAQKIDVAEYPSNIIRFSIPLDIDQSNFFLPAGSYDLPCMSELWPSLYIRGPSLKPVPYLSENLIIETHMENSSVPQDHTRFTFDIVKNAKWTDGMPVTAEDVVFSIQYALESEAYGNQYGADLDNLFAFYAPSTYRVVIEFETESYWHLSRFAYDYIIPRHIFNDQDGIGYENWDAWELLSNYTDIPTCGPFTITDYVAGEFLELSANPDFWYYPDNVVTESSDPLEDPRVQTAIGISIVAIVLWIVSKIDR